MAARGAGDDPRRSPQVRTAAGSVEEVLCWVPSSGPSRPPDWLHLLHCPTVRYSTVPFVMHLNLQDLLLLLSKTAPAETT